jgi:hypothetical protein
LKRLAREIWLKPLALGVLQAVIIYYILMPLIHGRSSLLFVLLASIAIYYLATFLFQVLNTEDKYLFKQYIYFRLKEHKLDLL